MHRGAYRIPPPVTPQMGLRCLQIASDRDGMARNAPFGKAFHLQVKAKRRRRYRAAELPTATVNRRRKIYERQKENKGGKDEHLVVPRNDRRIQVRLAGRRAPQ